MARDLDKEWRDGFKEYTADYQDEEGDTHTSDPVRAHVVTDKEFAGREVPVIGGGVERVRVGSVVTETSRPGVYSVTDKDSWEKTGYGKGQAQSQPTPPPGPADSGSAGKSK